MRGANKVWGMGGSVDPRKKGPLFKVQTVGREGESCDSGVKVGNHGLGDEAAKEKGDVTLRGRDWGSLDPSGCM